jgi:hypothetical protein
MLSLVLTLRARGEALVWCCHSNIEPLVALTGDPIPVGSNATEPTTTLCRRRSVIHIRIGWFLVDHPPTADEHAGEGEQGWYQPYDAPQDLDDPPKSPEM